MRKIIGVKMKKQKYIDEQTNKQTKKTNEIHLKSLGGAKYGSFFSDQ